jgi:immune inhibitor A
MMHKRTFARASLIAVPVVLAFCTILVSTSAMAAGPKDPSKPGEVARIDDLPDPLSTQQRAMRKEALQGMISGAAKGKAYGKTHEVARGQYVELVREGEDPIWTVLGEFSDFSHNSITEPDRSVDNTTIWTPDFSRDYYMDMLFADGPGDNSMRNYYIEQSSNRYTVYGDVTDWIALPGNACDYDDGDPGPGNAYDVWQFLIDSINGWYDAQIAAGMSAADIDAYLSQFDVWDRYDWDGDGNFDEPDGYIDHAQFVHAGEGNEAGGGALGNCAIWSHSWFAYFNLIGVAGPSSDFLIGGVQIGNSSFWVNKYTIQPENGGVGVFAHEYAHDLNLPDLYDYTGSNSTGFWSLMSSGSWLSQNDYDIGSAPNHLGAWDKFQLGWLNYEVAYAGEKSEHKLGPAETNTKQAQGLFVVLPDKEVFSILDVEPYSGDYSYWSGSGDDLNNGMFKPFTLSAGSSLSAMVNIAIEEDWDYAYLIVSTDGFNWETVETNLSTTSNPYGQNFGFGITGSSFGLWTELTADLSAYEGDALIGFLYWTDAFVAYPGFVVDDIAITGYPLDDAESDSGWFFGGFGLTTGQEGDMDTFFNAYVAEFRQYRGYDSGLTYAYNFTDDFWVERYSYQDGLLISYWDTSFDYNDTTEYCARGRCGGLLLPIDAHPELMYHPYWDAYWGNRVQTYDATFGLEPTDAITLHAGGEPSSHPSLQAVPIFDDNVSYWRADKPTASVITPQTGTQIRIKSVSAKGSFMQVEVRPSK